MADDAMACFNVAYKWLCRQRKNAPANADIWHLRWRWPAIKETLFRTVTEGRYRLLPMEVYGQGQSARAMWTAMDALVLKWVALQIASQLPRPEACHHLKGKGVSQSLREVSHALRSEQYRFVHRTDIRGYYKHINKMQLASLVSRYVTDPVCYGLIMQYIDYSVEYGGEIHTPASGIPRGCALSPLFGASLLHHIDDFYRSLDPHEIFYVRYMDDFLFFTRTRWQLRRNIARLAAFFDLYGFERHPDKTQTGRICNGFDWLGVWFSDCPPAIAPRALDNHNKRRMRLYEQARRQGKSDNQARQRVHMYDERWKWWSEGCLKLAQGHDAQD